MNMDRLKYFLRPSLKIKALEDEAQKMEAQVQELRLTVVDALSGTIITGSDDVGNPYVTKKEAVQVISEKYRNEQPWGCQLVQRIINQRKALVIPNGVEAQPAAGLGEGDDAAKEIAFIREFLEYNDFMGGVEDRLCRQSEMEGEVLVTLSWDPKAKVNGEQVGMPNVKRKLWLPLQWQVQMTRDDADEVARIYWSDSLRDSTVTLKPGGKLPYVHAAFNSTEAAPQGESGSGNVYRQGMPVVSFVLEQCENLHRSLSGWRKVNKYFANLTPFFQTESASEATQVVKMITDLGWKIGKVFAGRDMKLVGPQDNAVGDLIYDEIKSNAQIISGATGIPIHHLGFSDVIGQGRATAETLTEPMEVVAINDMAVWYGFYSELFDQAIRMRNEKTNGQLREGVVKPRLMTVSDSEWKRIEKIWMPAAKNRLITKDLFLEKLNLSFEEAKQEVERRLKEQEEASLGKLGEQLGRATRNSSTRSSETDDE